MRIDFKWLPQMAAAFFMFLIALSTRVSALETLAVVGPVEDAAPYYTQLLRSRLPNQSAQLTPSEIGQVRHWSGVESYDSGLSPARFAPTPFVDQQADKLATPVCLLANDQPSISWLNRNQSVLERENAICYLVKTLSVKDVTALRRHAPAVTFVALDPTFIIEQFAVPGYPALISRRGVEQ